MDILHDQKYKDVHFDTSNNWTHTTWDIRDENEVEAQAREAIDEYMSTNNYIYIDDVDYYESPSAKYYIVEFEVGEREDRVKFALDGTILP